MKVRVDPERCQGHTLCAMIAPKMFQLSDIDGTSSAVCDMVPPDQQELVLEAAHSCPEQAIVLDLQNNSSVASSGHGVSSKSIP